MSATLHIVGVGPGDPDLLTLKAARILAAAPVLAYFAKAGQRGQARGVVDGLVDPHTEELRLDYPFTVEIPASDPRYVEAMAAFYDAAAEAICARLDRGTDVALICEGDPFFYGSAMYIHDRLAPGRRVEVVPGVTGMSGCWTRAGLAMAHGDDVLSVLPGGLDEAALAERLQACDAAVIMKVGRNLPKIRRALARAGRADQAVYVERGAMAGERILPLGARDEAPAPYFSMVLVPGRRRPAGGRP